MLVTDFCTYILIGKMRCFTHLAALFLVVFTKQLFAFIDVQTNIYSQATSRWQSTCNHLKTSVASVKNEFMLFTVFNFFVGYDDMQNC